MPTIIKDVVMGSGNLYAMPVSEIENVFSLTSAEEAKLVNLGYIEANAALKSAVDKEEVEAANAGSVLEFIKKKTVTFQTGIFSWNLENVSKFLTGSDYTIDETTGKTTFSYAYEDTPPDVYLRFISEDTSTKKRITINMFCCSFSGELAFDFSNDKPVTFDYNFKLLTRMSLGTGEKKKYYEVILEDLED